MQDVNVVVVFYPPVESPLFERMEQLALAAAVGAVQGRANIRLRRLPGPGGDRTITNGSEYVMPRPADAEWADAMMVGIPEGVDLSGEMIDSVAALAASCKVGAVFAQVKQVKQVTQGSAMERLYDLLQRQMPHVLPEMPGPDALTAARLQGRRVADTARSLRSPAPK
jgi:hypothetical protein